MQSMILFAMIVFVGFYRGVTPGVTGSLATGATYFGFIESTKKWIEESHPSLGGHWAHFIAGAVGKLLSICLSFLIHPIMHVWICCEYVMDKSVLRELSND